MKIHCLTDQDLLDSPYWGNQVAELDSSVFYPFGEDAFRIDHGSDYYSFFRGMGELNVYLAEDNNQIFGVAAAVLRKLPIGPKLLEAWYLCDLKTRSRADLPPEKLKSLNQLKLTEELIACGLPNSSVGHRRAFAVSMNPGKRKKNPVARLITKATKGKLQESAQLQFFSLSFKDIKIASPAIQKHLGPISYASNFGKKDLVLKSTQQPMPLLHIQFGPSARSDFSGPQPNHIHMLCTPQSSQLYKELLTLGLNPHASATVLQHELEEMNWNHLLTSDI